MQGGKIRFASSFREKGQVVGYQEAIDLPTSRRCFIDLDRYLRRTFGQSCRRAVPGKRPTPVGARLIMWIDKVFRAEFVSKHCASLLQNPHDEVLGLIRGVCVAHPNFVFAAARNFYVLPNRSTRFVSARGD